MIVALVVVAAAAAAYIWILVKLHVGMELTEFLLWAPLAVVVIVGGCLAAGAIVGWRIP